MANVGATIKHVQRSKQARITMNTTDVDFDEFQRFPYANKIIPFPNVPNNDTRVK
jgi:hypothetical protein